MKQLFRYVTDQVCDCLVIYFSYKPSAYLERFIKRPDICLQVYAEVPGMARMVEYKEIDPLSGADHE